MRKFLIIIFFFILLPSGVLFGGEIITADNENIQYFGRWDFSDSATPSHSWPGVYIYAEFTGTSISVRLKDDFCYYNVYIDGELHSVFHNDESGVVTKLLASGLEEGTHSLLFSKRNETTWTKFSFHGFELDDGESLVPPVAKPERKIEFIGDSFTSASGNECSTTEAPDNVEYYTNIDKGFGPIVSKNFNAQYHMTSMSGIGMVLDWQSDYSYNMPDYFDRALAYTPLPKWDFEQWIPNLVVIGLGLNDYSGFGGWENDMTPTETDLYKTRYHEFISRVRNLYPGVKIVAVATHVPWMRESIAEIVDEEIEQGAQDIYYAQYSEYTGGYVNNGHPNVETHRKIAVELIAALDTIDAWSGVLDTIPPEFETLPESSFFIYDTVAHINLTTDTYATVKYSYEDKSYEAMEYTFDVTGKRNHSTDISVEHGKNYDVYLRAMDKSGNQSQTAALLAFQVDTTKKLLSWSAPEYDDNNWQTGATPLGYGQTGLTTETAEQTTLYLRKEFEVEDVAEIEGLGLMLKANDGIIVYLNGEVVARQNLPDQVNHQTEANNNENINKVVVINKDNHLQVLREGKNLFAAEVHCSADRSTGLAFNGQLFDSNNKLYFTLGSQWKYYDLTEQPQDQLVDKNTGIVDKPVSQLAETIRLHQNYPNPFNPTTKISYRLPKNDYVKLSIYDMRGRELKILVEGQMKRGEHHSLFDATGFASGIYFYKLQTTSVELFKKMIVLK